VLASASEDRILRYYAAAVVEGELEADQYATLQQQLPQQQR